MLSKPEPITFCYKNIPAQQNRVPILLDVYLPRPILDSKKGHEQLEPPVVGPDHLPAVIYFHGGGLTVGNRQSWFPTWLYKRVMALGYAFISADYQLLPPSTAHDIVEDVKDLFYFLVKLEIKTTVQTFKIDSNKIGVSGSSAGGLCAYLAAMHCSPRPKAVVSLYGMGGNFFIPHYICPKVKIFFLGREILDPSDFSEYLYPFEVGDVGSIPISDSALAYHPQTYHIPGYPANPRMQLCRLLLQLGTFLDYYAGMHEPSLSKALLEIFEKESTPSQETFEKAIPEEHRDIYPQLGIDCHWPPTMLLHGTADSAVPFKESQHMKFLLERVGVPVELIAFQDKEHSFDYEAGAEELWHDRFDDVKQFLFDHLESDA